VVSEIVAPSVVHLQFGYEGSNANVLTDHAVFDSVTGSPISNEVFELISINRYSVLVCY
jgi:hypothetical protein